MHIHLIIFLLDFCGEAMEDLMNMFLKSELGYSFSRHRQNAGPFGPLYDSLDKSFARMPKLQELTYPLLLAYSYLVSRNVLDPTNDFKFLENGMFLRWLKDPNKSRHLESSFNPEVLHDLYNRTLLRKNTTYIRKDMFLTAATIVMLRECNTTKECPDTNLHPDVYSWNGSLSFWVQNGISYCSIARAFYITFNEFDVSSINSVFWTKPQTSVNVTFFYPHSYVTKLIQSTTKVTESGTLSSNEFDYIMRVCSEPGYDPTDKDIAEVILPLTAVAQLTKGDDALIFDRTRVSTFALVTANIKAVQQSICDNDDILPDIQCE